MATFIKLSNHMMPVDDLGQKPSISVNNKYQALRLEACEVITYTTVDSRLQTGGYHFLRLLQTCPPARGRGRLSIVWVCRYFLLFASQAPSGQ
jgi:hypothetical protein